MEVGVGVAEGLDVGVGVGDAEGEGDGVGVGVGVGEGEGEGSTTVTSPLTTTCEISGCPVPDSVSDVSVSWIVVGSAARTSNVTVARTPEPSTDAVDSKVLETSGRIPLS